MHLLTACLSWLPTALRNKIESRPGFQKILANTSWLVGDRLLRMAGGLIVGIWLARYLGPEQFGLMNYAIAFVALFSSIATLGMNDVVIRDLVLKPQMANRTIGTAFLMQIFGAGVALLLSVLAIGFLRPDEPLLKLMIVLLGSIMLFKASEVVKYWFESQVESKHVVLIEIAAFILISLVKVAMLLLEMPLIAFIWAMLAEALIVAVGFMFLFSRKVSRWSTLSPSLARAKEILSESWPLLLSGLAVMIYMRIDQIMLGEIIGDDSVGIYSAAVRLSELWYFVPMAIVASVFPSILKSKEHDESLYVQRITKLYSLMIALSVLVAVPMTFFSDRIVTLLYGDIYSGGGAVLAIHVWSGIFVALGVTRGKWLLAEGLQIYSFWHIGFGAVINIVGNYVLIPLYDVEGAAVATLISQCAAAIVLPFLLPKTRPSVIHMFSALSWRHYLR